MSLAGDLLANVVQAETDVGGVGNSDGGGVGSVGKASVAETGIAETGITETSVAEVAVDEGGVGLSLALAEGVVDESGVADGDVAGGAGNGHVGSVDAGGGLADGDDGGVGGVGKRGGVAEAMVAEAAVEEGGVGLSLPLGDVDDAGRVGDVLALAGVSGGADGVVGVDLAEGAGVLDAVGSVGAWA